MLFFSEFLKELYSSFIYPPNIWQESAGNLKKKQSSLGWQLNSEGAAHEHCLSRLGVVNALCFWSWIPVGTPHLYPRESLHPVQPKANLDFILQLLFIPTNTTFVQEHPATSYFCLVIAEVSKKSELAESLFLQLQVTEHFRIREMNGKRNGNPMRSWGRN